MITTNKLRQTLPYFTGSETSYRWSGLFRNCLLTEGANFLAEEAGAFWLMDAIASYQGQAWARRETFQVWKLTKREKDWRLSCEDGNDNEVAHQIIEWSDFPLPEGITLWACNNSLGGVTIMLPTEY